MGRRSGMLAVIMAALATGCAPPWLRPPPDEDSAALAVGCEQAIGPVGPIHFAEPGSLVLAGALDLGSPDTYRHELHGTNAVPPESPEGGGDGQDFYKQGVMLRDGRTARIAIAPEARDDAALLFGTGHVEGAVIDLVACEVGAGEPQEATVWAGGFVVHRSMCLPLDVLGTCGRPAPAGGAALLRRLRLRQARRGRWAASARRRRRGGRARGRWSSARSGSRRPLPADVAADTRLHDALRWRALTEAVEHSDSVPVR